MTRIDALLEAVDTALEGHETTKAEALALVADNRWCVNALARRGIAVPERTNA